MALPLKESRSVADIAELLYDFLPGSGHSKWKGHVSFKTVAEKVGVENYWQTGSKIPMITGLIERTLEYRREKFEPLILEIVRAGLAYRQKKGNPVKPEEIDGLNGLILELGFKFPDLWDPDFKALLRVDGTARAEEHVERAIKEEYLKETERSLRSLELEELNNKFLQLHDEPNRQKAGFALERILKRLFELNDLDPRKPFRVEGEQIDGSFVLDQEVYLLEAKWKSDPCPESDLLVFRGKIEGKSKYTRGVFLSINGISNEAKSAITKGKEAVFFIMDGYDLSMILQEKIALKDFLRVRYRLLGDEGNVSVPFNELGIE